MKSISQRRWEYAFLLLFGLFNLAAGQTMHLSDDLEISWLEPDVCFVTHSFPWPANSLLIHLDSSAWVLVDTPWENTATRLLVTWLESQDSSARLIVINSHYHRDNLGGNDYLLRKHIPIYGSDLTVQLLKERQEQSLERMLTRLDPAQSQKYREAFQQSPVRPPDHVFPLNEGLQLPFGAATLEIFYPGPGHTPDNVVVYFPKQKILFGGCFIRSMDSQNLGNTQEADLKAWPESIKKLLEKYPDCRIVVPGHGQWGDRRLIGHTLELAIKAGKP
ncbi:subclass B1 metallo-beta-lactamase [candidate division KSB1 bacterium]|nr:subclass B1 metallo-beta-lactamase [candidate division KSB1 bacterium]